MAIDTLAHTTEDFEYLNHGGRALRLKLFRSGGAGPHPVVVDLHGGAWSKGDLDECRPRDEVLAEAGIAAAALNFRHAEDGYPSSLIDINYAVRWLKAHAGDLGLDPGRVGIVGQSSGGHLAMLAAMRPDDPRYGSISIDDGTPGVDATVHCVAMLWPVINPLSRYRHALASRALADPPAWVGDLPERHDLYWKTEEAMAEGNPVLALERGERVATPPAIWIKGRPDPVHDYRDPEAPPGLNEPERFAAGYRKAGGDIEVVTIDNEGRDTGALAPLTKFLSGQLSAG